MKNILSKAKKEGVQSFHLIGHADEIGSKKINYEVGLRRASTVGAYIQQFGISEDNITIVSKGKTAPIVPNDDENRAKNRRVEVIFK
jgi:outer membrane protein OmpA-like peptidoglycan-associated protein